MLYHDGVLGWIHAGEFAVDVFFALSGWLISGILLRLKASDLKKFFFNRAVRIWVPYYFAISLLLVLSFFREPITEKWLEIVVYKLTFVYNLFGLPQLAEFRNSMPQKGTLSHVWSVNAEEQFYLIAPLILVLGAKYYGRSIFLWALFAISALLTNSYAAIVLGVTASVAVHQWGSLHTTKVGRFLVCGICLIFLGLLILDFNYGLIAPFAAVSLVLALSIPGTPHKFGKLIGGMSYPLYLNHWVGVFAFNYLLPNMRDSAIRHGLSAITNIVFAILLYWFLDRYLLEKREVWFTPARGRWITNCAYIMVTVGVLFGLLVHSS